MITKNDKINILETIKRGETIPDNENNSFILFDLVQDGLIQVNEPSGISLTHFGHKELAEYDPFLQVSVNYQLVEKAHGDA